MDSERTATALKKGTIIKSKSWGVRYGDFYSHRGMLGFIVLATDLVMEDCKVYLLLV